MPPLRELLGITSGPVAWREASVSLVGGFVAIAAVLLTSQQVLGLTGVFALVASTGASTVLLFAVPHGPLSQPWPLLGGQTISAVIGVTCAAHLGPTTVAAAAALGLSLCAMHLLRCVHPPGGASALVAVLGGEAVRALGYSFVVRPVLLNAGTLLVVALVFNNLFGWRRYPAALRRRPEPGPVGA